MSHPPPKFKKGDLVRAFIPIFEEKTYGFLGSVPSSEIEYSTYDYTRETLVALLRAADAFTGIEKAATRAVPLGSVALVLAEVSGELTHGQRSYIILANNKKFWILEKFLTRDLCGG
jgi:hypothetical protein